LYSLDRLVDDAAALGEALLPKVPYVLFGKSAGGFLALKFALRYPDRVSHLVLACTTAQHGYLSERASVKELFLSGLDQRYRGFRDRWEDAAARIQDRDAATIGFQSPLDQPDAAVQQLESLALDLSYTLEGQFELVALVRDAAAGDFALLDGRQARGRRTLVSTGAESPWVLQHISCRELLFGRSYPTACVLYSGRTVPYDIRGRLGEIGVPVLMISGRYDPIVPLRFQQEIVEGVAGPVQWEVFDLSAHMVFVEQPSLAMQLVLDFLGVPRQQIPQGTGL
jgi:pimeloyl-ACP methyl ester carboxylesterase